MTKLPLDAFSYLYDIDETSRVSDCKSETAICLVFLLSECLCSLLWFYLIQILAAIEVKRSLLLQVTTEIIPTEDGKVSTHNAKLFHNESKK